MASSFTKRLNIELLEITNDPPTNCSAKMINNTISKWRGTIIGPEGSPYSKGKFLLDIEFPSQFPFKPPKIKFLTKIFHPNISKDGNICLDILKDQWSPVLTMGKVLLSISSLMVDPNPNDPLEPSAADLYRNQRKNFDKIAREWTDKYAKDESTNINVDNNNDSDSSSDDDI